MRDESGNPIVISGMYRSGTSILWRIMSADPVFDWRFYEPLHPYLLRKLQENAAMRVLLEKPESIRRWSPRLHFHKVKLKSTDSFPELRQFLDTILVRNSLTKFTRMTLRLSWLVNEFPEIFMINIIRDPRAVCYSYLKRAHLDHHLGRTLTPHTFYSYVIGALRESMRPLTRKYRQYHGQQDNDFERNSVYWYRHYLRSLVDDEEWGELVRSVKDEKPPIQILTLWKMNTIESSKALSELKDKNHITVKFEEFVENPRVTLERIYRKMGYTRVPEEVLSEIRKDDTELEEIGSHEYNKKLSNDIIYKWKEIPNGVWLELLKKTDILQLMKKLGYA